MIKILNIILMNEMDKFKKSPTVSNNQDNELMRFGHTVTLGNNLSKE